MKPRSSLNRYQRFGGTVFKVEHTRDSIFLRNIIYQPNYTASHQGDRDRKIHRCMNLVSLRCFCNLRNRCDTVRVIPMVVTNEFVVDPLESFSPWLILKDVKDKKYCNLKQGGYNCLYCEPCLSA